jgi:hypothetical protein
VKYLAAPLIGLFVTVCPSVAHSARDCILPGSGYENYDCNKTFPPIPEVEGRHETGRQSLVWPFYRSGAASRVCSPPRRH